MSHLTRDQEARRILEHYGKDEFILIMEMLERQFTVLHNRAQVLLGLCGIVITTTGFSGRIIANTDKFAQISIVIGVSLVLLAAAVVVWGVLHLRWLTIQPGESTEEWLMSCLTYRDKKTNSYRIGIALMLIGLTFYVIAIADMLLHPQVPYELPVR